MRMASGLAQGVCMCNSVIRIKSGEPEMIDCAKRTNYGVKNNFKMNLSTIMICPFQPISTDALILNPAILIINYL